MEQIFYRIEMHWNPDIIDEPLYNNIFDVKRTMFFSQETIQWQWNVMNSLQKEFRDTTNLFFTTGD